jgi:hypothetical protein
MINNYNFLYSTANVSPFLITLKGYNKKMVLNIDTKKRKKPPLNINELDSIFLAYNKLSKKEFYRYMMGRCNENSQPATDLLYKLFK